MQTVSISKEAAHANRRWLVVDAENIVLGRMASKIAHILRGKHKCEYTPHVDTGDYVIVLNADKVKLTGRKEAKKIYYHHTGWVGGVVGKPASQLRAQKPEEMVILAVRGMLPKGPLGRAMLRKLKVYRGGQHPHTAQQPAVLAI